MANPQKVDSVDRAVAQTIQTAWGTMALVLVTDSDDEAQATIDYNRRNGREAAATHYNEKHQVYAVQQEAR